MPFFSVIIPTYNRAVFLKKAIKSVLDQEYTDWELLIIDDGSTDNTSELVKSYHDPRVRYIFQQNAERSVARNNGIENAKGKYICFLDSDDYYLPNHLINFYNKIKESNDQHAMFVSGIFEEAPSGGEKKDLFDLKYLCNPLIFYWENTILTPISICIHQYILKENKFIPEFNIWEDTHLWLRILAQYPFYYINDYTAVYVRHESSGVIKDMAVVKLEKVKGYIAAINHLFKNYPIILQHLTLEMKRNYIDKKYNMFIYQARINKQYRIALQLILFALINKFTWSNLLLFLKLPFHIILKHA
jgi:glycosyltransferase involved in cell wall biosynthesis